MRAPRLLAACFLGALAGCSLITSFDGLGSGGAGGASSSTVTSTASSGGAATGGGGATTTSANGGGGSGGAGTSGAGGAAPDAGPDANDPCPPGTLHCGTGTDHDTLYSCNAQHMEVLVEHCAHGCVVRAGADDMCGCFKGGLYCGGDDLVGNENTLYTCKTTGGIDGTVKQHCPNGCVVAPPGSDDHCK